MWAVAIFAGMLTGDYEAATIVSPVMLAVAGYAFGTEVIDRVRGRA